MRPRERPIITGRFAPVEPAAPIGSIRRGRSKRCAVARRRVQVAFTGTLIPAAEEIGP
jgi:hypothetical protein